MSVRHLASASSEKIVLGLGALGFAFGPGTLAAVIRPAQVTVAADPLSAGATAAVSYELRVGSNGKPALVCNGTAAGAPAGMSALSANSWYLIAATKATGTVAPRLHKYDFGADTWTHADSASTLANSSVPITRATIGTNAPATSAFWDGDLAAGGIWNVVLTDQQIQDLLLFSSAVPKGLWRLNQDTVAEAVLDLTGGGADQSSIVGTSITAVTQPVGMMNLAPPKLVPNQPLQQAVNRAASF